MKSRKLSIASLIVLSAGLSCSCNDDKISIEGEEVTCVDDSSICAETQVCDEDTGKCRKKTCKDDASICKGNQICGDDGKCKDKTCKDDASICKGNQICGDDGKCKDKTCKDDSSICNGNQICGDDGKCKDKTCKDDSSICNGNQICGDDGKCKDKTCKEDPTICTAGQVCDDDGKCENKPTESEKLTCESKPTLCKEGDICEAGECSNTDGTPNYCSNYQMQWFLLDHIDLLIDIASATKTSCSSYNKLVNLYKTEGKAICDIIPDCNQGSVASMNKCAEALIKDITLNDDTVFKYITDISKDYPMRDHWLLGGSSLVNEKITNANKLAFSTYTQKDSCDEPNTTCSAQNVTMCQDGDKCVEGECAVGDVPRFCNDYRFKYFMYDHIDLINDIVSENSNTAYQSYNKLVDLYKTEGKALCNQIADCNTGSVESMNRCVLQFIKDGSIGTDFGSTDINILTSGDTNLRFYDTYYDNKIDWDLESFSRFRNLSKENHYAIKSCSESANACKTGAKCINDECASNGYPDYCSDPKMQWFLLDHFDLINDMTLPFDSDETIDIQSACSSYNKLAHIFETEGKELCKEIVGCTSGTLDSMMRCTVSFFTDIVVADGDYFNDLPDAYPRKAQLKAKYNAVEYTNNRAVKINDYRTDGCSEALTCTEDAKMCKTTDACVNGDCATYKLDSTTSTSPILYYCAEPQILWFFLKHFDLLHDIILGANTQDGKCMSYNKFVSLLESDGIDVCNNIPSCTSGKLENMHECVEFFMMNYISSWDNLAESLAEEDKLNQYPQKDILTEKYGSDEISAAALVTYKGASNSCTK